LTFAGFMVEGLTSVPFKIWITIDFRLFFILVTLRVDAGMIILKELFTCCCCCCCI
jgi:hypothetical protein